MSIEENKIIIYQDNTKNIFVNVIYNNENLWANQKTIAELFGVERPAITKHINNIIKEGELKEDSTCSKMEQVQNEGNREIIRETLFYNLDMVIAVGYRVNSKEATKFRIWATNVLKEYIQKGFVLNDELLKNGKKFGKDYFDELLERIRDIRASERRSYQKIADIFQTSSSDYDKNAEETKLFYKIVQNKIHFAISNQTAAEIIYNRADSEKQFMGLTNWKGSPDEKIMKSDTLIAKNYLNEKEMDRMNRLVVMFIDFAEFNAIEGTVMMMKDWLKTTDNFLSFNKQEILTTAGKISHDLAIKKATDEYEKFKVIQDKSYISDFDIEISKYLKGEK